MTACLCYRRGKDYENKWHQQWVFKGSRLRLGYQPSFGALASTPLQQSRLLSASQQWALWYMRYGKFGLLAWHCCPKEPPSPGCRAPRRSQSWLLREPTTGTPAAALSCSLNSYLHKETSLFQVKDVPQLYLQAGGCCQALDCHLCTSAISR